jgi:hypothetical protein
VCPYEGCDKKYASEGSLNLHIKQKHNGGNKTDREKLAKNLIICKAKGIIIPEKLEINLPPGIVKEKAHLIQQLSNIQIDLKDLDLLENKMREQCLLSEQEMKRQQLQKAEAEAKRAQQMVADQQCTPPKKMAKLQQRYKDIQIKKDSQFLEPLPKVQKTALSNITNTYHQN